MICQYCFSASMERPADNHPAYVICPNCQAIELTYTPQDYQQASHEVPYVEAYDEFTRKPRLQTQLIGYFGGLT